MSLQITNVTLPDMPGNWHIAIANGYITQISAESILDSAVEVLDAGGNLLIPGLVDPHIHLDKALLLDRYPAVEGTFTEALRKTLQAKQEYTVADIQARSQTNNRTGDRLWHDGNAGSCGGRPDFTVKVDGGTIAP